MRTSYRIIDMHVELSMFVPISGKSQFFCTNKACLQKIGLWKF